MKRTKKEVTVKDMRKALCNAVKDIDNVLQSEPQEKCSFCKEVICESYPQACPCNCHKLCSPKPKEILELKHCEAIGCMECLEEEQERMETPKPSGTKSLKEIHKIVDEIREEIENPKPTKIKLIEPLRRKVTRQVVLVNGLEETRVDILGLQDLQNKVLELIDEINKLKLSH